MTRTRLLAVLLCGLVLVGMGSARGWAAAEGAAVDSSVVDSTHGGAGAEELAVGDHGGDYAAGHGAKKLEKAAFPMPAAVSADGVMPPALWLVLGALLLPGLPRVLRSLWLVAVPAWTLWYVATALEPGMLLSWSFAGYDLMPLRVDALSRVFGLVFSLVGVVAGLYAWHNRGRREACAAMLYNAGALGVTFAGDLFTLYAFWELMAVASTLLIWERGRADSQAAGIRYVLVHLFGGALLLAGALLLYRETGSLLFGPLDPSVGLAGWLLLLGIAVNAAVPPLGAWLPDAYPRATITGAVYCSALTTKTAVYALLRGFAGWEVLVPVGCVMVIFGVVYGLLANDIRRVLAYCIVSQVGYMVAACGMGSSLALDGAAAHAVAHILYKSLLFMAVGAVIYATGREKLSELGGLVRMDRLVLALYVVGALSIAGAPGFNGFISKSMVTSAAQKAHLDWVFLVLMLGSVGTAVYAGLRLPFGIWGGKSPSGDPVEWRALPWNMVAAMGLAAAGCLVVGVRPGLLYGQLPFGGNYEPFTVTHFVEMGQILAMALLGFVLVRPWLRGVPVAIVDSDVFYRLPAARAKVIFIEAPGRAFDASQAWGERAKVAAMAWFTDPTSGLPGQSPRIPADEPGYDEDRTRRPVGVSLAATLVLLLVVAIWILLRGVG